MTLDEIDRSVPAPLGNPTPASGDQTADVGVEPAESGSPLATVAAGGPLSHHDDGRYERTERWRRVLLASSIGGDGRHGDASTRVEPAIVAFELGPPGEIGDVVEAESTPGESLERTGRAWRSSAGGPDSAIEPVSTPRRPPP